MIHIIILTIIAIMPIIILLKYVFDKDVIEKEPIPLLIKLFILGILSTLITIVLSSLLKIILSSNNDFYVSFIRISLVEEISKWIIIYLTTWSNKEFDYIYDAIIYSVFVSLGFACFENIIYTFNYGIVTSIFRAVISVPGHAFFAIYMGYYLGMSKLNYKNNNIVVAHKYKFYSILIPVIFHGIYDYCLLCGNIYLYLIFIIFVIFLYISSFKRIDIISKVDINLKK